LKAKAAATLVGVASELPAAEENPPLLRRHREAFLIRNTDKGDVSLPSLSKQVSVLFTARASRVDKLKRAVSVLNIHTKGANLFSDGFYIRLWLILEKKGKLDYPALTGIAEKALEEGRK
jgi:hypothetical protein